MPTNLALDDKLIAQAVKLGKHKTKKEAVTAALDDYIRRHKRQGLRDLVHQVAFHDDFNLKALRRRRTG